MPTTSLKFKRLTATAALLLATTACASGNKRDPDKEDLEATGDDDDGDLSKPSKKPATTKDDGSSDQQQAVADDGYDDDWNNIGSQQAKQANNKNNAQAANNNQVDEPPIQNTAVNQAVPANEAVANPVADQTPPPMNEPPPDAEPAPVAEAPAPAPKPADGQPLVASATLLQQDVQPVSAELVWVGYDFLEKDSVVKIELVTHGTPKFNIFQERNKNDQPELVVRFFHTKMRSKVRRDINASEFRSPVAFVRMRWDEEENSVDVIMTMRDPVQPRFYAKGGNVLLTFPVPDHYFGNSIIGGAPTTQAAVLANANVMPQFDAGSELAEGMKIAKAIVNNPGDTAFKGAPADGGAPLVPAPVPAANNAGNNALPADFSNAPANAASNVPLNGAVNPVVNTSDAVDDMDLGGTGGNALDGEPVPGGAGNNVNTENADDDQSNDSDNDNSDADDDDDAGGDGDSSQEIDKFDVREKARPAEQRGWIVTLNRTIFATKTAAALYLKVVPAEAPSIGGIADVRLPEARAVRLTAALTALDQHLTARVVRLALLSAAMLGSAPQAHGAAEHAFSIAGVAQDDGGLDDAAADFPAANTGGNAGLSNAAPANNAGANPFANSGGNAGANAAPVNAPANPAASNASAFGNTTANPSANANSASKNNAGTAGNAAVQPASFGEPAVDASGAASGEPPVAAGADLSGQEQQGNDTAEAPQPSSGGRPIKLDFRGAPLTEVIRALSEESGVNFVFPPEIGSKAIYITFNNVPFNDALHALLQANALGMVEAGPSIVRIDTLDALARDKENLERRRKAELKFRPTKVLVQRLSYAKATDAKKMLQDMLGASVKEDNRVAVQTDERTNSIIVNASPNDLSMVRALLERIDLETPQVKITTRVVELLKKFGNSFGVSWGGPLNYDQGRGLGLGSLNFPNYVYSKYAIDPGLPTSPALTSNFHFGSVNKVIDLDLKLAMAESRSTVEILQSGDITVEDQYKAVIVAGSEDKFRKVATGVTAAGAPTTSASDDPFDTVHYELKMEVQPHVTASGAVSMEVFISNSSPGKSFSTGAVASRDTREVRTKLIRQSGETAVVGGIFTTNHSNSLGGVPFLSALPIIGALFRSTDSADVKRELLVMLTPVILPGTKVETGAVESASPVGNVALNDATGDNDFGESEGAVESTGLNGNTGNNNAAGNNNGGNSGANNNGGANNNNGDADNENASSDDNDASQTED